MSKPRLAIRSLWLPFSVQAVKRLCLLRVAIDGRSLADVIWSCCLGGVVCEC